MPTSLDVDHVVNDPVPSAFPNGCHIAEVEIDPDTGAPQVVKYSAVNDLGTVVNPLLVAGQIHGGVMQGLGQALLEQAVYDSDGQLVTGSFMDYAMPRAHDAPMIDGGQPPVPTKSNPLGAKGCGEAGTSGGLPGGRQRGDRRALRVRHPPSGNADDAGAHLASDQGRPTQTRHESLHNFLKNNFIARFAATFLFASLEGKSLTPSGQLVQSSPHRKSLQTVEIAIKKKFRLDRQPEPHRISHPPALEFCESS